uniref:Uncharacterized protein n=1 Tax=Rhizophora mucronata TaxID=61149 RepID=A0A2P2PTX9_RHIMU
MFSCYFLLRFCQPAHPLSSYLCCLLGFNGERVC